MDTQAPTADEWRALHDAAIKFKQAKPWEWTLEDDLIGIEDPETGTLGFISIMGAAGEHFAVSLYLGVEGLAGFWDMHLGASSVTIEQFMEIPQLQASFEDRAELDKRDREVIKSLGLKFRGRNEWPLFRSHVPGHAPWFVSAAEARFLTVALQQGLEVAQRLKKETDLLEPSEGKEDEYLVRTLVEGEWRDIYRDVELPEPESISLELDEKTIQHLRKLRKTHQIWLTDLFLMPGAIQERRDRRPTLAYILVLMDAQSGMIFGIEILGVESTLDKMWQRLPAKIASLLMTAGGLPQTVIMESDRLAQVFEPLGDELGFETEILPFIPALDAMRTELLSLMR